MEKDKVSVCVLLSQEAQRAALLAGECAAFKQTYSSVNTEVAKAGGTVDEDGVVLLRSSGELDKRPSTVEEAVAAIAKQREALEATAQEERKLREEANKAAEVKRHAWAEWWVRQPEEKRLVLRGPLYSRPALWEIHDRVEYTIYQNHDVSTPIPDGIELGVTGVDLDLTSVRDEYTRIRRLVEERNAEIQAGIANAAEEAMLAKNEAVGRKMKRLAELVIKAEESLDERTGTERIFYSATEENPLGALPVDEARRILRGIYLPCSSSIGGRKLLKANMLSCEHCCPEEYAVTEEPEEVTEFDESDWAWYMGVIHDVKLLVASAPFCGHASGEEVLEHCTIKPMKRSIRCGCPEGTDGAERVTVRYVKVRRTLYEDSHPAAVIAVTREYARI